MCLHKYALRLSMDIEPIKIIPWNTNLSPPPENYPRSLPLCLLQCCIIFYMSENNNFMAHIIQLINTIKLHSLLDFLNRNHEYKSEVPRFSIRCTVRNRLMRNVFLLGHSNQFHFPQTKFRAITFRHRWEHRESLNRKCYDNISTRHSKIH